MCQYDEISDEELIARLREGENSISDYLMEKYKGMVRQKARAMFLIGGDTDDLIQEGMIGLFKAVQDFKPQREASFQTFARLCVDRQIYNAIQTSRRQKHQPLNSYVSLSTEEVREHEEELLTENPESIVIDKENTRALKERIRKQLSAMENQVLDYYLEGEGYVKIAELLGKSPKAIDNALQRIRAKIRAEIEGQHREDEK